MKALMHSRFGRLVEAMMRHGGGIDSVGHLSSIMFCGVG